MRGATRYYLTRDLSFVTSTINVSNRRLHIRLFIHNFSVATETESGADRENAHPPANVPETARLDVTAHRGGPVGWFLATPFSSPSSAWTGECKHITVVLSVNTSSVKASRMLRRC